MSPPSPLGAHYRSPLGAFYRTPLGAFGLDVEEVEPPTEPDFTVIGSLDNSGKAYSAPPSCAIPNRGIGKGGGRTVNQLEGGGSLPQRSLSDWSNATFVGSTGAQFVIGDYATTYRCQTESLFPPFQALINYTGGAEVPEGPYVVPEYVATYSVHPEGYVINLGFWWNDDLHPGIYVPDFGDLLLDVYMDTPAPP